MLGSLSYRRNEDKVRTTHIRVEVTRTTQEIRQYFKNKKPYRIGGKLYGECAYFRFKANATIPEDEKIFKLWDELQAGQVLRIINDHDPKPLWYQFEVEYKSKYKWEYEQKGPKDWIVKIKKM